ncbi:hypothetical protein FOPG_16333 [Fusarium oxysporum f. sp. conglutinans race 2 54008]|uniref:Transcription factor domain-containing protein n=2 Tax=Fusarium oxysporum f. sp. conglutinans TaxID=100902 RepID=X0GVY1_FUSOX|nr:hypothetical protein FOPG_16333 [Fusarium oxysporum f. sp. conglutinans race 2 54008]
MLTLCAAFLGRMSKDDRLLKRAMVLYGRALKDLSGLMAVANLCPNDFMLATIMCLGMSEVYSPPTLGAREHGWTSHNQGGCELLKTRGASLLHTQLGQGLFLRFRVTGLYTAIGMRKPCSFAEPSLRTVSRLANQNYYDVLIDIMVDLPGLLHDVDALGTSESSQADLAGAAGNIMSRGWRIAEHLRVWIVDLLAKHPLAYHWRHSPEAPVFPLQLHFQNLLAAQALIHFWAAMAILVRCFIVCQSIHTATHPTMRGSFEDVSGLVDDMDELNLLGFPSDTSVPLAPEELALYYSDKICCSVAYCTSLDKRMVGPIVLLFPLWIAKNTYADGQQVASRQKERFCAEVFRSFASRGMQFSGVLEKLSNKSDV